MTSEIAEDIKDFDETEDTEGLNEAKVKTYEGYTQPKDDSALTVNQAVERYEFDKTTMIIGLQILPTNSEVTRKVLISAVLKESG